MQAAARWITEESPADDRFFLFVDEFDPHEPFDTPEPYASMYDADWTGPHLIWPPYADGGIAKGVITEREGRQIRAQYGAKLTMIDAWFGRLLDAHRHRGPSDDTVVIVCTDHGHYLGERDIGGASHAVPVYEPLGHIPLMISWPGVAPGSRDALTTTVDLHATIARSLRCRRRAPYPWCVAPARRRGDDRIRAGSCPRRGVGSRGAPRDR